MSYSSERLILEESSNVKLKCKVNNEEKYLLFILCYFYLSLS